MSSGNKARRACLNHRENSVPTSYTASIHEGEATTFREFALRCARAMMLLRGLREPVDAPLPDVIVPDDLFKRRLAEVRADLAKAEALTDEDAERGAMLSYEHALADVRRSNDLRAARKKRYEEMLASVEAWSPPTAHHGVLRQFMVELLNADIRYEDYSLVEPKRMTGQEWKKQEVARAKEDVEFYRRQWANEQASAEAATRWLSALKGSLPD